MSAKLNIIYLPHRSPICTSPDGHSHLYVLELHTRSESHVFMAGSHGSQRFSPTGKDKCCKTKVTKMIHIGLPF